MGWTPPRGDEIRYGRDYSKPLMVAAVERGITVALQEIDLGNSYTSSVDNITDPLSKAAKPIQQNMVDHFTKADPEFGKRVAKGLTA